MFGKVLDTPRLNLKIYQKKKLTFLKVSCNLVKEIIYHLLTLEDESSEILI